MVKISPVSGDLVIKLLIAAAVAGVVLYTVKGATDKLKNLAALPGEMVDSVLRGAREAGATWQGGFTPNPDYSNEGRNYGTPYTNPLINDSGYDFGNLSG